MIRVLIAASSAVIRSVLKEIILRATRLEWVGEAASYDTLKSEAAAHMPDVILSDKPLFDAVRNSTLADYCHTAEFPTIVYYSGEKPYYSCKKVMFYETPDFINFTEQKIHEYSAYLEQLLLDIKCSVIFEKHPAQEEQIPEVPQDYSNRKFKAVVVGVSTGGPGALLEFLKGIGQHYPLPIIITQHIDSFFDKNLISWLSTESSVPVHLAENNCTPQPGHVYFAPSDEHVTFFKFPDEIDFRIVLNHDEPVNFLRPSVDKMFQSAATVFGENCIAVVLTGMGSDGARECLHLKQLGAYTITQDKDSSVIYGMPKATYEMGGSCEVLPLKQIPERLWSLTGQERE